MNNFDAVSRLRKFIRRLVKDGVPTKQSWREWKKQPDNIAFMSECFAYTQLDGMPAITNIIKPFFHPELPLVLLNYTQVAHNTLHHFADGWTPVVRLCRGIVFDLSGKLVAFPFPKFFNYGEMHGTQIPDEPFEATVKEDGHLLIIFWYRGHLIATTRGYFTSSTAQLANTLLPAYEKRWARKLPKTMTLLAEFIHPQTHVIVDYGDRIEFRVNGAYDLRTLGDLPYEPLAALATKLELPIVERWQGNSLNDLVTLVRDRVYANKEGFVARFVKSGLRLKFKFAGYIGEMIGGKLDYGYVINQLLAGTFDSKMADLPGEVQEKANELKGELLKVRDVQGGKKARFEFLYGLLAEEERTDYRKTKCREFHNWLVETGQVEPPVEEKRAPKKRSSARAKTTARKPDSDAA